MSVKLLAVGIVVIVTTPPDFAQNDTCVPANRFIRGLIVTIWARILTKRSLDITCLADDRERPEISAGIVRVEKNRLSDFSAGYYVTTNTAGLYVVICAHFPQILPKTTPASLQTVSSVTLL